MTTDRPAAWASDPVLDGLAVYRVGGAVRDEQLGLAANEHDFVVVGATPDTMIERNFRPVGQDFPVFLHPHNHAEFALARTERKSAPGYRGFVFHAGPDVTLELDLMRRDLTINAIAEDRDGQLIDPCGGLEDLHARCLRHVSPAFCEDPVRLLRLARFATRFRDFQIAEDTHTLCAELVESGEVDALVPERVWQEMERALAEPVPDRFFRVLRSTGALQRIMPEFDALFEQPPLNARSGGQNRGEYALQLLNEAASMGASGPVRYACLVRELSVDPPLVSTTGPVEKPVDQASCGLIEPLSNRLRLPKYNHQLAMLLCRFGAAAQCALRLESAEVVDLIQALDGWRRADRFEELLLACSADVRVRASLEASPDSTPTGMPDLEFLAQSRAATQRVDVSAWTEAGQRGPALAQRIRQYRIECVESLRASFED
ncbi:MAG: multifunctional CCA tRNA nucleotidyl transferase/2'3'-cyclic phosphodiesterase/2'nucleotidase/phosphatase [Pseudomonadota bacterium]